MDSNKRKVLGLFALLLIAVTALIIYEGSCMRAERALRNFSKEIEKGNLGEISLTIYCYPTVFTQFPWSIEYLITRCQEDGYVTVVDGAALAEHADLLRQLNPSVISLVKHRSVLDARLYYVFENKNGKKILEVAGSGDHDSLFVNGVEVEYNTVFYRVIIPFLPEIDAKMLEDFMQSKQDEITAYSRSKRPAISQHSARVLQVELKP